MSRVGLNGTVVGVPHLKPIDLVSLRTRILQPRLALHSLQRLGSYLNSFSWKKNCSPAVKTNSALQSTHFKTLSANSISIFRRHLRIQRAALGYASYCRDWHKGVSERGHIDPPLFTGNRGLSGFRVPVQKRSGLSRTMVNLRTNRHKPRKEVMGWKAI